MKLKVGDRFYLPCTVVDIDGELIDYHGDGDAQNLIRTHWKKDIEKIAVPIKDTNADLRHATPYAIKRMEGVQGEV